MTINWDWTQDDQFLGEDLPGDTLDRQKYANYLYEVCAARGENSNLVLNINAKWGAGKTYFTKRLVKTISTTHPTVYIDAWKNDFSDDPLLTVFSSIKTQLSGQSDKFTSLLNKTISSIGPLLKTATPIILKGLAKKYIDTEIISDLTKDLSTKLLELHSEKSKKIDSIRNGISEWVRFIEQKDGMDKKLPLFIVIDELDRCRPTFAISLLEITKHIFNIPGVVFIIATDTEQLQHSIKVVYGNEFSASHYLSRFFDRRFLLPHPKLTDFLRTMSDGGFSENFDNYKRKISPCPPDITTFIENCASILEALKMNLRDSIKLYQRVTDSIIASRKNIDAIFFLILSGIDSHSHEIYSIIKRRIVDKSQFQLLNELITVSFDLSQKVTDVLVFFNERDSNMYANTYRVKEKTITLAEYINTAQEIILTPEAVTTNIRGNDALEWTSGGLRENESLDTYLKMGWASTKSFEYSLTLPQYYDLIELSTTFE